MFAENVPLIESQIADTDLVLDIGAWWIPYSRADYVIDLMPYETRGHGGRIGVGPERFSANTWVEHDVCSRGPLPFPDQYFDYVICSHTLEDIRDPVYVCSEIQRIGKRGYVEVPSRLSESIVGSEGRNYVGLYHHRWLVEIDHDSIVFQFKPHVIHESRKYHLPKRTLKTMSRRDEVQWLFWEGHFEYAERIQLSLDGVRADLEAFVEEHAPMTPVERLRDVLGSTTAAKDFVRRRPRLASAARRLTGRRVHEVDAFWRDVPEIRSN